MFNYKRASLICEKLNGEVKAKTNSLKNTCEYALY